MILVFSGLAETVRESRTQNEDRELLREFYATRGTEPKPYQVNLREAQLAHSRGDRELEIELYRNVMNRFRAEDRNPYSGLTGSPTRDLELEELLAIMLSEDETSRFSTQRRSNTKE